MPTLTEQGQTLARNLRELGAIAVAFSGGLDSRFLIHAALNAGISVRALHVTGPHVPAEEHRQAVAWAALRGVDITVLPLDPLTLPGLRANPKDRCYHCKTAVFTTLRAKADAAGLPLCDGTNASDYEGYRPGLKALAELGVVSPLAQAGLRKSAIRALAAQTGMDRPDQAALPCLLTRFNYGLIITAEKLTAVDAAENAVEQVLQRRFAGNTPGFRLRYTSQDTPVLHLALPELDPDLVCALQSILTEQGFAGIPIETITDLSGYFDRV